MRPPELESGPTVDETVRGRVLFGGSMVGLLFESEPPIAYDLRWEQAYGLFPGLRKRLAHAVTWSEEVVSHWHADAPAVGGETITRVILQIENVQPGRKIRLIYPTGLHSKPGRAIVSWP